MADLILFDPQQYQTIRLETFQSKGKNSPFFNWMFNGRIVMTLIAGRVIYSSS